MTSGNCTAPTWCEFSGALYLATIELGIAERSRSIGRILGAYPNIVKCGVLNREHAIVLSATDESKLSLSLILAGLTRDVVTARHMFFSSRHDPALARAYRKGVL
jgi:hypothetical protein